MEQLDYKYMIEKLDRIHEKTHDMEKVLVKQEQNLAEHMKRSDTLEKHVKVLEEQFKPVLAGLNAVKITASILAFLISAVTFIVTYGSKLGWF
jgi:hypothetical protein